MRTCRIGFHVVTIAIALGYVSSCTCPPPRGARKPATEEPKQAEEPPVDAADLAAEVATFADEACACEDKACADAVEAAFTEWAAAHADAVGSNQAGDDVAAQVARMGACTDKFRSDLPLQGESCVDAGECAEGLECVRYYGIAGDKGPQLATCEIQCGEGGSCPEGMSCKDIADGPSNVCRK